MEAQTGDEASSGNDVATPGPELVESVSREENLDGGNTGAMARPATHISKVRARLARLGQYAGMEEHGQCR